MKEMQEEMAKEFENKAGGGMVSVSMSGRRDEEGDH